MKAHERQDLSLRRYGLLFASPDTEKGYRVWRIHDAIPFIRVGMFAGLFTEIAIVIYLYWLAPDQLTSQFHSLLIIAIVPLLVTLCMSYYPTTHRWMFPATVFVNTVTGSVAVLLMHDVMVLPIAPATAPYTLMACLILVFYAFTIFRLPILAACMAVLPYVVLTSHFIISDVQEGSIPVIEAQYLFGWLAAGLVAGIFSCCVLSVISRRNYVSQQTIGYQQTLISRYIPQAVAEQIRVGNEAAIAEPKRQRVTVLFSDIVGFTDIADRVEPEVMTQVLSEYMSCMAELIESHGGTLNEFAGDGLMALFGAPDTLPPEDQARSALRAAIAMQQKMPELNAQWRKLGLGAELKVRIGINTGMVSVGSYGSQGRMTYTAIGLQTNIASRIESQAAPGEILLSDASYQLISDQIECEPRGEVECKGVHFPVKVYAPAVPPSLRGTQ